MLYTYQHNGQTYTINLEPQPDGNYTITIGDRVYKVQAAPLAAGGWRLTLDDQHWQTVYTAAQGSQRFVNIGGETYTLTQPESRSARRKTAGGASDLNAQMPGQVVAVLISEGETVEKGQTLMVLEAMKMEIRVAAPVTGRVKKLLTQPGAVVERGQRLLEIEETD